MKTLDARSNRIASHTVIALMAGALFLSACGKNSGFQSLPLTAPHSAEQTQTSPMPTEIPAPTPDSTSNHTEETSPIPEDREAKANPAQEWKIEPATRGYIIQTQPAQANPPEFQTQEGSYRLDTVSKENQASYDRYRLNEEQKQNETTAEEAIKAYPLAWETKSNPERKAWSDYTMKVIDAQFSKLDQATDAVRFCPNYTLLENKFKKIFWAMLISEVSFHESSWKPTARSREGSMGTDPVTKDHVYSEGLLQLSYQDTLWSSYCQFDWSKDKSLSKSDPSKTIFNPYLNLSCGIRILSEQIARKKQIILRTDVYWSVLRQDGKYTKITEMTQDIRKRLDFCN